MNSGVDKIHSAASVCIIVLRPTVILRRIRCQSVALENLERRKDTDHGNSVHLLPMKSYYK